MNLGVIFDCGIHNLDCMISYVFAREHVGAPMPASEVARGQIPLLAMWLFANVMGDAK